MTSVAVVSSAVARITRLKDKVELEGLTEEIDKILFWLEVIQRRLVAAHGRKLEAEARAEFAQVERETVRISYEIVYDIADVSLSRYNHTLLSSETMVEAPRKLEIWVDFLLLIDDYLERLEIEGVKKEKDFTSIPILQPNSEEDNDAKKKAKSEVRLREKLLDLLSKQQLYEPLDLYVVGGRGMGKTTLARKLFDDPGVRSRFDALAWVPVKHEFKMKEALRVLLPQLRPELDTRQMKKVSELMGQIFGALKDRSYLIVVEDIGDAKDAECLRFALPLAANSAIIFTTSSHEFARGDQHHYISAGLAKPEILRLLIREANFHPGTEKVGEAIFEICGGSPLFATILGRSLKDEVATASKHQSLVDELCSYMPHKGTPQVLGASYWRLAPELKPQLLYMSLFPPGHDIDPDILYLLLAAEDLIEAPEQADEQSLFYELNRLWPFENSFFLSELARLKLIQLQQDMVPTRSVSSCAYKSCRLHHQVREFCKFKGLDEEFLQVVDFKDSKQVVGTNTRRLAVYMRNYRGGGCNIYNWLQTVGKILSLLIFDAFESAEERSEWPMELSDLTMYYQLRVLCFDQVDFRVRKLPKGVEKLSLLRFLSFRGCFMKELPSYLSSLVQLETLDLLVQEECRVVIPGNFFTTMKRMVHLFLPRRCQVDRKTRKPSLRGLEMMETLLNFDTEVFDVEDLLQLTKLKILSTVYNVDYQENLYRVVDLFRERRKLVLQHSSMEIRFNSYDEDSIWTLSKLLGYEYFDSIQIEGRIRKLPGKESDGRVAEIVLRGSELKDDPMGYFGSSFLYLRSLVLADDAFTGTKILIPSSPMFPELRILKLRNLQYLEKLTIEEGAVRKLMSLQIEYCGDALELTIPEELYHMLKNKIGGDAYSVVPSPSVFNITTP